MVRVTKMLPPPVGGLFEFQGGYGVVILSDRAVIFLEADEELSKKRVRGRSIKIGDFVSVITKIPKTATAIDEEFIPPEIRLAMTSVSEVVLLILGEYKLL